MRIERPRRNERFGAVHIHEPTQVIEIDSGHAPSIAAGSEAAALIRPEDLSRIESSMAVVVPTMNERRKVIEGVLSGIPHDCLIIMVSASELEPVDRYAMEGDSLESFTRVTGRKAVMIHQRDAGLAKAVEAAGYGEMLGDDGLVRPGKGEAMLIGMLLAEARSKTAVGFIDADNYVPGAVHEYVKSFAAGLHLAPTPYAMVRISWHSKPKVEGGRLVFNRWGRTSQVTNRFLNAVLSVYNGYGTEMITTGNAGEHAMTMELARHLRFGGGFSVEPFELIEMFEQYGGAFPSRMPEIARSRIDVFQVETRNPHFHEDKGADHVEGMRLEALNALYHSRICPEVVRDEILEFLSDQSDGPVAAPEAPRIYRPMTEAAPDLFAEALATLPTSLRTFGDD